MFRLAFLPVLALMFISPIPTFAEEAKMADSWLPTLITETPEQGFELALTMARKAVTTTQTDKTTLHALRPNYSTDPQSLIDASGVVAAYFSTIAAANDYWRD